LPEAEGHIIFRLLPTALWRHWLPSFASLSVWLGAKSLPRSLNMAVKIKMLAEQAITKNCFADTMVYHLFAESSV